MLLSRENVLRLPRPFHRHEHFGLDYWSAFDAQVIWPKFIGYQTDGHLW